MREINSFIIEKSDDFNDNDEWNKGELPLLIVDYMIFGDKNNGTDIF